MALSIEVKKEYLKVVSSKDPCVGPKADYTTYIESLDEALLDMAADAVPTRFVMRRVLPYSVTQKIKSMQSGVGDEGKMEIRLGFMMEEVRAALIDVENPGSDSIKFEKDKDGYASKDLMVILEGVGITNELYAARQNAVGVSAPKKS